jgi:hypothetical protein
LVLPLIFAAMVGALNSASFQQQQQQQQVPTVWGQFSHNKRLVEPSIVPNGREH